MHNPSNKILDNLKTRIKSRCSHFTWIIFLWKQGLCGAPTLLTKIVWEVDLDSKFTCWWVSLQSYKFSFKHSLNNPATSILVISSPKTLSFSDLIPYHLLYISLSSFVLPLLCLISSFSLISYSFLLFSSNSLTNPHLSALTPLI